MQQEHDDEDSVTIIDINSKKYFEFQLQLKKVPGYNLLIIPWYFFYRKIYWQRMSGNRANYIFKKNRWSE